MLILNFISLFSWQRQDFNSAGFFLLNYLILEVIMLLDKEFEISFFSIPQKVIIKIKSKKCNILKTIIFYLTNQKLFLNFQ